jgi:hypothetical protein
MSKLAPDTQLLCHTDQEGRKRPLPLYWALTAFAALGLVLAYTEQGHSNLASGSLILTIVLSAFLFKRV